MNFLIKILTYEMPHGSHNYVWHYMVMFFILLIAFALGRIFTFFINKKVDKTDEEQRTVMLTMLKSIRTPVSILLFSIGFLISMNLLTMSEETVAVVDKVVNLLFSITVVFGLFSLIDILEERLGRITEKTESKLDDMLVPLMRRTLKVVIVIIVTLHIIQNIADQEIGPLLASLGIGGLAFALAAQDMIKNMFGSVMIITDRPFHAGDRILIEGVDAVVEDLGFRSTKIRTLTGHLVSIPNSIVANTKIENIGKRPHIRRLSNITITYDTPAEKVERAVEIIREILDNHEGMDPEFPPRVYFNDFNDCSLNIIMLYWYHPPSYWDYMAFTEKVNLQIFKRFNKEGIEFAFPTYTVFHANDDNRQLQLRLLGTEENTQPH